MDERNQDGRIHYLQPDGPSDREQHTGIFAINYCISIRHIGDGTSFTIMVGERSVTSGAGIWPGVTANMNENDVLTDGSHASRPNHSFRSYSSTHLGVNFLMADGSVRAIDPGIDSLPNSDITKPLGVFQRLSARNDGQIVDSDVFLERSSEP